MMEIPISRQDEIYKLESAFDKIITKYLRTKLKADVSHKWCILRSSLLLYATTVYGTKFPISSTWDEYFCKNAKLFWFCHIFQCAHSDWKKRRQGKLEQWTVHSSQKWIKKQGFYEKKNNPKKVLKMCWFSRRGIKVEKKARKQTKDLSDIEKNVFER